MGLVAQLGGYGPPCPRQSGDVLHGAESHQHEGSALSEVDDRGLDLVHVTAVAVHGHSSPEAGGVAVESWYFQCSRCGLVLPAQRAPV